MRNYQLQGTEKLPNTGIFRQHVLAPTGPENWDFWSIRAALVWPSTENPAYFVIGGEETWDERVFSPASGRGVIRILEEYECDELSLDSLFNQLTDGVSSNLAEAVYLDLGQEDYKEAMWDYLDRKRLRNISVEEAPYADFTLRMGILADFNKSGELLIEKTSPLYQDLQGISAIDLKDSPEIRFYRLNALSYLVAGFHKFPPLRRQSAPKIFYEGGSQSWMR